MPQYAFEPPTAPTPGFVQTIRMSENGKPIGMAAWHAAQDTNDGVVQIVEFQIVPEDRRRGHGRALLTMMVRQWAAYHASRKTSLRSAWVVLRQKRHVIARSFFMSQGFNHVATVKDLFDGEDALVYVRAFN
jgi:ribosomal protein S18 acetylase RimI-like enzyme